MKKIILATLLGMAMTSNAQHAETQTAMVQPAKLEMTQQWDKVFPQSNLVEHKKVTFVNRYGFTLAADMYIPKNRQGKLAAIAVSGPFGTVKEQSSGLYAQTLAERGFITIAFDPSFTGESSGEPRNVSSPDINTEDFSAAVDFLSVQPNVDAARIGVLGVCGWGGIALNATAQDTRIKAAVASTMYDMTRIAANGYNDENDNPVARREMLQAINAQRTKDYAQGYYDRAGANLKPEELTDATPQFVKDYTMYYETTRGFHPRSVNSVGGWNKTAVLPFINNPFMQRIGEIQQPVLIMHGEKAHSLYFSKTAYSKLTGSNKELLIISGANHTDLYDGGANNYIPFDKLEQFYKDNLK